MIRTSRAHQFCKQARNVYTHLTCNMNFLTNKQNKNKVARNGVEKLRFVLFNDLLVYGQAKRRRGLGRGLLR